MPLICDIFTICYCCQIVCYLQPCAVVMHSLLNMQLILQMDRWATAHSMICVHAEVCIVLHSLHKK